MSLPLLPIKEGILAQPIRTNPQGLTPRRVELLVIWECDPGRSTVSRCKTPGLRVLPSPDNAEWLATTPWAVPWLVRATSLSTEESLKVPRG